MIPAETAQAGAARSSARLPRALKWTIAAVLVVTLAACDRKSGDPERPAALVQTQTAELIDYSSTVMLTGEIRAQVETDLSFRLNGRVTELDADVGSHVEADQVLARIAPNEQQADVTSDTAAVAAAEAAVRQTKAALDRQVTLLAKGFTTRAEHDGAEEAYLAATSALDAAHAQRGTALDALSFTELRAGVPGIITARNVEVGQIVQGAGTIFRIAQDGPRDAVFDVFESLLVGDPADVTIALQLVQDPAVVATGHVREVSPTVDSASGTVKVKVGIDAGAPGMPLGSAVTGKSTFGKRRAVLLPWTALSSDRGNPAVWIVDPQTNSVSLRDVEVVNYETGKVAVGRGLVPGDVVVTAGLKLLRPGQVVAAVNQTAAAGAVETVQGQGTSKP